MFCIKKPLTNFLIIAQVILRISEQWSGCFSFFFFFFLGALLKLNRRWVEEETFYNVSSSKSSLLTFFLKLEKWNSRINIMDSFKTEDALSCLLFSNSWSMLMWLDMNFSKQLIYLESVKLQTKPQHYDILANRAFFCLMVSKLSD